MVVQDGNLFKSSLKPRFLTLRWGEVTENTSDTCRGNVLDVPYFV
jgi:hypothetical protein